MKLFIVIPTYNRCKYLKQCLESLGKQTCQNFNVLVVVDGSTDGTLEMLNSEFQTVDYILGSGHWWWTKSINEGIRFAIKEKPTHLLLLNDDVLLPENFINEIYKAVNELGENALFNAASKDAYTREWHYMGIDINWKNPLKSIKYVDRYKFNPPKYIDVSLLYGRGLIIPTIAFKEVGLFDEKAFPQAMADSDFSLRAKKLGYELKVATRAFLYSYVEETSRKHFESHYSLKNFFLRLFSKRSSSNLLYLLKFNYRHCPRKYFIQYNIINFAAVKGGYFVRWFKQKATN